MFFLDRKIWIRSISQHSTEMELKSVKEIRIVPRIFTDQEISWSTHRYFPWCYFVRVAITKTSVKIAEGMLKTYENSGGYKKQNDWEEKRLLRMREWKWLRVFEKYNAIVIVSNMRNNIGDKKKLKDNGNYEIVHSKFAQIWQEKEREKRPYRISHISCTFNLNFLNTHPVGSHLSCSTLPGFGSVCPRNGVKFIDCLFQDF